MVMRSRLCMAFRRRLIIRGCLRALRLGLVWVKIGCSLGITYFDRRKNNDSVCRKLNAQGMIEQIELDNPHTETLSSLPLPVEPATRNHQRKMPLVVTPSMVIISLRRFLMFAGHLMR